MTKTSNPDLKNAASYPSGLAQRFLRAGFMILCLLAVIIFLIAAFPLLYEIKTKAGIDIVPGVHTGPILEKYSHGLVKCEWLYPYDCSSHQAEATGLDRG